MFTSKFLWDLMNLILHGSRSAAVLSRAPLLWFIRG